MSNPIKVILTCDARYINPLRVIVLSLLKTANPTRELVIYVAHDQTFEDEGCREAITALCAHYPFSSAVFLNTTHLLDRHRDLLASEHNIWAPIIWAGPLLTDVLPNDVCGRIVYLDVDMLVCHRLDELFDIDLQGRIAAAAFENDRGRSAYLEECEWSPKAKAYYNNGTMLIDLDAYRREDIANRIVSWYGKYKDQALCTDQDAQNAVFGDRILTVPMKWNYNDGWVTRLPHFNPLAKTFRSIPVGEILEAMFDPHVIHYVHRKPWTVTHRVERKIYHQHMKELGIFDESLNGRTLRERLWLRCYDAYNAMLLAYGKFLRTFWHAPGLSGK